ncbi:MAG: hypothetical protein M0R06_18070 [Sphaerochaeta sp.]|jgi:hypothetical protein|nr:hypothetical protein [Sphaerochaeta sp.]
MTQETLDTTSHIHRRHPARKAFAGCPTYYANKGEAYSIFDESLAPWGLTLIPDNMPDNEGWKMFEVVNRFNCQVGYARLSWYRLESGRYEVVGYLS